MNIKEMTKDEKSLVLFLEVRATDNGGRVDVRHMNEGDMNIAEEWNVTEFISFGRIVYKDIATTGTKSSHWCHLSDEAFGIAHQLRREKAERMWGKRNYRTTAEKNKK